MPAPKANTLPKQERLCGKTNISALITKGRWGTSAHLKYCWYKSREDGAGHVVVSVSKKFFKRAVKRNLLKRRMREAYRTQKGLLTVSGVDFLLAWSSKEIADYETVRSEVSSVLSRISKAAGAASESQNHPAPADLSASDPVSSTVAPATGPSTMHPQDSGSAL